jgi:ribosomal protein L13E
MEAVKPKVYKANEKQRHGKGFSRGELSKAKLSLTEALKLAVPVDSRRKTLHEENVAAVKAFVESRKKPSIKRKTKRKSKS